MFAVIKTGGKQYVVKEGDVLDVEKIAAEAGETVTFNQVLLIEDGNQTLIGTPLLENAVVLAEVMKNFKGEKILVFKKKRRKQFRRTRGHRQPLTEVKIGKIYAEKSAVPAEELKAKVIEKEAPSAERPEERALPKEKPAEAKAEREEAPQKRAARKGTKEKTPKKEKAKEKAPAKEKRREQRKAKTKRPSK
jgi:large subunit ribosomal protein L21